MPIIPGTMGIKTFSYEMYQWGEDIFCEDCAEKENYFDEAYDADEIDPIFADTELSDKFIKCVKCGYESDLHTYVEDS